MIVLIGHDSDISKQIEAAERRTVISAKNMMKKMYIEKK